MRLVGATFAMLSAGAFIACAKMPVEPEYPRPRIFFSGDPSTITRGKPSTLKIKAEYAEFGCLGQGDGKNGWLGPKLTNSAEAVYPRVTTTYVIVCSGYGGTDTASVTITVLEPVIEILAKATPDSGDAPLRGVDIAISVSGTGQGDVRYQIDCTNDGISFERDTVLYQLQYNASDVCAYIEPGRYTYLVRVTQQEVSATVTGSILVSALEVAPIGVRSLRNRPDDSTGKQLHVLYAVASDGVDRQLDINGTIDSSVAVLREWMLRKGLSFRFDTYSDPRDTSSDALLDISFVRASRTEADLSRFGSYAGEILLRDITRAGFVDPDKLYVVFYGGGNIAVCSAPTVGWEIDLVTLFLNGTPLSDPLPCSAHPFAKTATDTLSFWEHRLLRTVLHARGYVDPRALHYISSGGWGYVNDNPDDVMYSGPDRRPSSVFDFGNDDYCGDKVPQGVRNCKNDPIITITKSKSP